MSMSNVVHGVIQYKHNDFRVIVGINVLSAIIMQYARQMCVQVQHLVVRYSATVWLTITAKNADGMKKFAHDRSPCHASDLDAAANQQPSKQYFRRQLCNFSVSLCNGAALRFLCVELCDTIRESSDFAGDDACRLLTALRFCPEPGYAS